MCFKIKAAWSSSHLLVLEITCTFSRAVNAVSTDKENRVMKANNQANKKHFIIYSLIGFQNTRYTFRCLCNVKIDLFRDRNKDFCQVG